MCLAPRRSGSERSHAVRARSGALRGQYSVPSAGAGVTIESHTGRTPASAEQGPAGRGPTESVYDEYLDSADVVTRLKRDGWKLDRQRGSHRQYTHPTRGGRVTVPHPRKDIPIGTLRNIYRQAGWPWGK